MARTLRFASQGGDEERRVTWLELFFDLVYVAAFGEIALRLGQIDAAQLLSFVGLFAATWFSWLANTLFAARYGNDTRAYARATLTQLLALGALAASVAGQLSEYGLLIALAFAVGRGVLALLYWVEARQETGRLATRTALVETLIALLWLGSALVGGGARWGLWGAALLLDLLSPLFTLRREREALPHEAHLPERLGQLFIIVLGVVVVELVSGAAEQPFAWRLQLPPALGLAATVALWQLYFEGTSSTPVRAAEQGGQPGLLQSWIIAHLPLMGGLTALGAGLGHTVAEEAEGELVGPTLGLVFLSLAALRYLAARPIAARGPDLLTLYLILAGLVGGGLIVWLHPGRLLLSAAVAALSLAALLFSTLDARTRRTNERLQKESAAEE